MTSADVVVVGAGIVGAWVAAKLAVRAPGADILVVDKGEVAGGASALSAGLHMRYGRNAAVRRLAAESAVEFENLAGCAPDYPIAPLRLFVQASATAWPEHGAHFLSPGRAHDLDWGSLGAWPAVGRTRLFDRAHGADVAVLTRRLLADAGEGVRVATGRPVTAIEGREGSPVVLFEDGARVSARLVVAAPGPWATVSPFAPRGLGDGVRVKKIVSMTLDATPAADDPAIFFVEDDAFLLPRHDLGQWIFSYACPTWDVAPDEPQRLEPDDVSAAAEALARHRPDLVSRFSGGRVFCDAYTPERAPRVEFSPERRDLILAIGGGGSGHRLAPALANRAAALAVDLLRVGVSS